MAAHDPGQKVCFVTVGATASFNALLKATLSHNFLSAVRDAGYTDLLVQYGKEGKDIYESLLSDPGKKRYGLRLKGFGFDTKGLTKQLVQARNGVVISHAGSGTILDALRLTVPLIVVPNPDLLDNHQEELAEALAKQGYVIHGKLENLPAVLPAVEILRQKHNTWPPVNSGPHRGGSGLKGLLDEETGFLD